MFSRVLNTSLKPAILMKKSSQEMVLGSALNFSEHFYERPVCGGCINLGFHDEHLLLQINNRNTRKRCEICSKLTIKTPERRRSGVFIANFELISHLFLVLLLLTLNKQILGGYSFVMCLGFRNRKVFRGIEM